jgi:hypothetical protein
LINCAKYTVAFQDVCLGSKKQKKRGGGGFFTNLQFHKIVYYRISFRTGTEKFAPVVLPSSQIRDSEETYPGSGSRS